MNCLGHDRAMEPIIWRREMVEGMANIARMIETEYGTTHEVLRLNTDYPSYHVDRIGGKTDFEFRANKGLLYNKSTFSRMRFIVFDHDNKNRLYNSASGAALGYRYSVSLPWSIGCKIIREYMNWEWTGIKPTWWNKLNDRH